MSEPTKPDFEKIATRMACAVWEYMSAGSHAPVGSLKPIMEQSLQSAYNAGKAENGLCLVPIDDDAKNGDYVLVYQSDVLEPQLTVCSFDKRWSSEGWWFCCDGKDAEIPLRGSAPTHYTKLTYRLIDLPNEVK